MTFMYVLLLLYDTNGRALEEAWRRCSRITFNKWLIIKLDKG